LCYCDMMGREAIKDGPMLESTTRRCSLSSTSILAIWWFCWASSLLTPWIAFWMLSRRVWWSPKRSTISERRPTTSSQRSSRLLHRLAKLQRTQHLQYILLLWMIFKECWRESLQYSTENVPCLSLHQNLRFSTFSHECGKEQASSTIFPPTIPTSTTSNEL